ncbi:hypothetical protein D3C80_1242650 [compost metagenome]
MHQALKIGRALQVIQHSLILPAIAADQHQPRRLVAHAFLKAPPDGQQEGQVLAGLDRADMDEIGATRRVWRALHEDRLEAQVGDLDRRRLQPFAIREGQHFVGGVLGVDQDTRRVVQGGQHSPAVLAAVARATEFRVGDGDQVVQHDHALNPLGLQAGQNAGRVQTGVADIEIQPGRGRRRNATRAEVLFPHTSLFPGLGLMRIGRFADDGGGRPVGFQRGEQTAFVGVQFAMGGGAGPAAAQLRHALPEPAGIDRRQLIMA